MCMQVHMMCMCVGQVGVRCLLQFLTIFIESGPLTETQSFQIRLVQLAGFVEGSSDSAFCMLRLKADCHTCLAFMRVAWNPQGSSCPYLPSAGLYAHISTFSFCVGAFWSQTKVPMLVRQAFTISQPSSLFEEEINFGGEGRSFPSPSPPSLKSFGVLGCCPEAPSSSSLPM